MSDPEDPPKDPPAGDAPTVDALYPQQPSIVVDDTSLVPNQTASGEISTPDEPLVPASADLSEAVGAPTRKRQAQAKAEREADDDAPPVKRNKKVITIAAGMMLAALVITTFILLGRVNSQRFAITCSTDHVTAEQGRSFPPWGTQPMIGPEWKPIALPPNAECKPRETENKSELEGWYLDLIVERASTALTTPNLLDAIGTPSAGKPAPNLLDTATAQLEQALLLSRSPDRRDQRKEVERLQGDVQYWRAALRLRDASAALLDASRQFEAAAQQRPRHVTDAAAWSQYVKKLADDLRAGPNGAPASAQTFPPTPTAPDHPSAPAGAALPVETPPSQAGSDSPPPTPDAGVPTGGVLL